MCASFCVGICFHSFGYIPKSGIGGLYANSMFNFLRNCQTIFQSSCIISHFRQQCRGFQRFLILPNTGYYHSFFMIAILWARIPGVMSLQFWFSISLVATVEHLFMCLLATCVSSSQKCLGTYTHFKIGLGLPWWLSGKVSACQCRKHGFNPWPGKIPHALGQLSPCTTTTEPVLWSPAVTTAEALPPYTPCSTREASTKRSLHIITREWPLFVATREKPAKQWRPSTVKNK